MSGSPAEILVKTSRQGQGQGQGQGPGQRGGVYNVNLLLALGARASHDLPAALGTHEDAPAATRLHAHERVVDARHQVLPLEHDWQLVSRLVLVLAVPVAEDGLALAGQSVARLGAETHHAVPNFDRVAILGSRTVAHRQVPVAIAAARALKRRVLALLSLGTRLLPECLTLIDTLAFSLFLGFHAALWRLGSSDQRMRRQRGQQRGGTSGSASDGGASAKHRRTGDGSARACPTAGGEAGDECDERQHLARRLRVALRGSSAESSRSHIRAHQRG